MRHAGPETRTIATAERPSPEAIAYTVSPVSSIWSIYKLKLSGTRGGDIAGFFMNGRI
jgi:hypothetical protein